MRSHASAKISSQYGFCSRVRRGTAASTWTWTRAVTGLLCAPRRISLSVIKFMSILRTNARPRRLFCRLDHTAGDARAGVAGRISLQVVFFFMKYDRFTDDRIRAVQLQFSSPFEVNPSGSVGGKVAQVAGVMFGCGRPAVMLMGRIKMRASR